MLVDKQRVKAEDILSWFFGENSTCDWEWNKLNVRESYLRESLPIVPSATNKESNVAQNGWLMEMSHIHVNPHLDTRRLLFRYPSHDSGF